MSHLRLPWWLQISNSSYCTISVEETKKNPNLISLSAQETSYTWLAEQTEIDGNTNKGRAAVQTDGSIGQMQGTVTTLDFSVSHLEVWVELAAIDVVVVTPEHCHQLSRVQGIHSYWAAAWHKHKLWAAATRHCELKPFTTLVGDLPVIYLRDKQWGHTGFRSCQSNSKYKLLFTLNVTWVWSFVLCHSVHSTKATTINPQRCY